nr:MAG TPA: hypothetical protein [Caudoviricetes sp.]
MFHCLAVWHSVSPPSSFAASFYRHRRQSLAYHATSG